MILLFGLDSNLHLDANVVGHHETMHHTFVNGERAKIIWRQFGAPFGFRWEDKPILNILQSWWSLKAKNKVVHVINKMTPIIICWELWKVRCASRYGGIKISSSRSHFQVLSHQRWVIYKHNIHVEGVVQWHGICDRLLSLTAKIICFPVTWEKYLFGWTKLNADGSKQDNDLIGAGSILRDHRGDMIKVFSQKLGSGTSNLAEA